MIYTKSIHVDMARQYLDDIIRLHEGDANGAQLQISLFNNGAAFDLTNYTVKYDAVIAGYLAENDAAADSSSNMITVPITANMCAKSGTLEIDVKILEGSGDNERVFFLQRFEANVQRRVINEDVIIDVSGTTIGEKIAALEAKFPVKTADIANAAVTTGKIASAAVTTGKIADAAVTTDKIASGAITGAKLETGCVSSDKILNGSILSEDIAPDAVQSSNIADNAVTSDKILNGSILSEKIASGAVTFAKLAADVGDRFMRLAYRINSDDTRNIKEGQLFFYNGRYYVKDYYLPETASQTALANYTDVTDLGTRVTVLENVVGDANALLESALHYQNGG